TTMTQRGTLSPLGSIHPGRVLECPAATKLARASVMMPMDFCASFEPCEKAMAHADRSCSRRDTRCTVAGRTRRKIHRRATITKKATTKPIVGERTRGMRTFSVRAVHLKACVPACATTAPASPPTSACEELDGIPYHHVMRFQIDAPMRAASTHD